MTENDPTASPPPDEEPVPSPGVQPAASPPPGDPGYLTETGEAAGDDPGYLTETGEAAGDDGSVAPIIGGLPAVEGSAWDIGAPLDDRGGIPADEQASRPGQD